MHFHLVTDARNWWRWHSTHVFAVLAVFPAVWAASPDFQAVLPAKAVTAITTGLAVLGFILRLRRQTQAVERMRPTVPGPRP